MVFAMQDSSYSPVQDPVCSSESQEAERGNAATRQQGRVQRHKACAHGVFTSLLLNINSKQKQFQRVLFTGRVQCL